MDYSLEEKKAHKKFSLKLYYQRPDVKKKHREQFREYCKKHPDKVKESNKKAYHKFKALRIASAREFQKRSCRDPILGDIVTYNCLVLRIRNHPDIYGDKKAVDYMIHVPTIKGLDLLNENQREALEKIEQ